jgi:threonine aldolase
MEIVELRSDTFTKPTPEMRRAMAAAEVGDDAWGEDPTVNALQERCAALFGKDAALFMPTGTMANEASLKTLTQPGDEVVTESTSHIVLFENGAPGLISGVVLRAIDAPDARLDPAAVRATIRPHQPGGPRTAAVWLEDTHNARGGRAVPVDAIRAVATVAHEADVPVFLDGARIFNAALATGSPVSAFAAEVDALTFCFSKALGAPAGSMVMGTREFIERLGFYRRALGGAMRQVGLLAAAAAVALDTGVDRLAEDHANARRLALGFADALPGSVDPSTVETNILFVDVGRDASPVVAAMRDDGVRVGAVGPTRFRAVTHRDVTKQGIERAIDSFARAVRS